MELAKILILCIFFLHIEAFQSFRRFGEKDDRYSDGIKGTKNHISNDHINDIKYKILRDKTFEKHVGDFGLPSQSKNFLPPYLKKRNSRFKSIYNSMHDKDHERQSRHRSHVLKPSQYGHLEYQQFVEKNEIPDDEILAEMLKKSLRTLENEHSHHKKHHYSRSHHKIKRFRSKPEVSIMQKKLKV